MAALAGAAAASAAELPSGKKGAAKPAESLRSCDIGGITGVLTANGVCVKLSGVAGVDELGA